MVIKNFKKLGACALLLSLACATPVSKAGFWDVAGSAFKFGAGACLAKAAYNGIKGVFETPSNNNEVRRNTPISIGMDTFIAAILLFYAVKNLRNGGRELVEAFKAS